jgi:hypothetical protein
MLWTWETQGGEVGQFFGRVRPSAGEEGSWAGGFVGSAEDGWLARWLVGSFQSSKPANPKRSRVGGFMRTGINVVQGAKTECRVE